uniref:LRAT domain-containing protein n=1 Tax=Chelydra serpentina TaxID=8475 RepID=A0A8C3S2P8_CHESE
PSQKRCHLHLQTKWPKPGDLIEIDRRFYKHWGVYVGDDYIVHLTDVTGKPGSGSVASINCKAVVKKDPLKDVVGNCNYRVNNKHDGTLPAYPVPEIIARAIKRVGESKRYQVFAENCEHFANEIRYNIAASNQRFTNIQGLGGLIPLGEEIDNTKVSPIFWCNPVSLQRMHKKPSFPEHGRNKHRR